MVWSYQFSSSWDLSCLYFGSALKTRVFCVAVKECRETLLIDWKKKKKTAKRTNHRKAPCTPRTVVKNSQVREFQINNVTTLVKRVWSVLCAYHSSVENMFNSGVRLISFRAVSIAAFFLFLCLNMVLILKWLLPSAPVIKWGCKSSSIPIWLPLRL